MILKIWRGESKFGRWLFLAPLFFLSKLYGFCLIIRTFLYNSGVLKIDEVSIPVLAIGNITIGGTGKTPLVEKLASRLKEAGFNPAIITRGYKRTRQGTFCIDRSKDSAADVGDEALMLARKTKIPIVVGTRRSLAIVEAMKRYNVDLAILDDGYQVRNVRKDIDVVVVKGGEHNKCTGLFPLGPCREPISRLKDADVVLVNNGDISPEIAGLLKGVPTFEMTYKPVHLYNMKHNLITHYNILKKKKVLAFSGLGDNRSFFDLLRSLGAIVVREISFQDHHVYRQEDIEKISSFQGMSLIVTTEKDAVKIFGMTVPDNLFYLSIDVSIEKEHELVELILKRIGISGMAFTGSGVGDGVHKQWAH